MNPNQNSFQAASATFFIACTSHMDWDWIGTFEDYYASEVDNHNAVRDILNSAHELIKNNGLQFNLAEIAWLERWLEDYPEKLADLTTFQDKLYFMGGGITSPDNLVCNGEVFIRNFLVGRQYLKKIGLSNLLLNICWIPDDFGQDPELPVVLKAMGLQMTAFWRVPGDEPSTSYTPVNSHLDSLYKQLMDNGAAFNWQASDGSVVKALLLIDGYGVPFYVSEEGVGGTATASVFKNFVEGKNANGQPFSNAALTSNTWPGNNMFAPAGGDFSQPADSFLAGITDYNNSPATYNSTTVLMQQGTLVDYGNTLNNLKTQTFNPSNFWTGYFASRPQLKINQNRASRYLLAAETAYSLLQVYSKYSSATLRSIGKLIQAAWESLVPSSHHDFVTGTAPDNTYWAEQLPLSEQAVETAKYALDQSMRKIADAIQLAQGSEEQPVLLYNDLGFVRPFGDYVELENVTEDYNSVLIGGNSFPVQKNANTNTLVFQAANLPACAYQVAYLSTQAITAPSSAPGITVNGNTVNIDTGTLRLSLSKTNKWGITSLEDSQNPGQNYVNTNSAANAATVANEISIYNDSGNLYQFGNEPGAGGQFSAVAPHHNANLALATIGDGTILENGPLRWRFEGQLQSQDGSLQYTLQYTLYAGEPAVHMSLSGQAPSISSSVVTSFPMVNGAGAMADNMNYGTANHWHKMDYTPYWPGPTFRATHNFVQLTNADVPMGSIYHQGTPAWALDQNVLKGVLLRNGSGVQRGAAGTDTAPHVQRYVWRLFEANAPTPETCTPIKEAYALQAAPFAQLIRQRNTSSILVDLPEANNLVNLESSNALVRMVRTQVGSGTQTGLSISGNPLSLIMRIYQASNLTDADYTFDLPLPACIQGATLVNALEEQKADQSPLTVNNTQLSIAQMETLTTVQVQTNRVFVIPNNGK